MPVDPGQIVFAEREVAGRPPNAGAHFGFADGHVEYIEWPRAARLIALFEAGAESITIESAADAP